MVKLYGFSMTAFGVNQFGWYPKCQQYIISDIIRMDPKQTQASSFGQKKQTIILTTNITPKDMRRKFQIYPEIPLHKYIELYEQVFQIDLYAYRVTFQFQKSLILKLEDLKDKGVLGDREIEVELIVESVGG